MSISKLTADNPTMFSRTISTALGALLLLPASTGAGGDDRSLSFYHTHTGRELSITYFRDGQYLEDAMQQIGEFLADWRNGERHDIDPALMDILWRIQMWGRHTDTWEVISAYRSPETNEMLRKRSSGVARKSEHLSGRAIDVRLHGFETKKLHDIALELKLGGVGYYEKSDFVHVDTGRVRHW